MSALPRYEKVTAKGVEVAEVHIDGLTVRTFNAKQGAKTTTYPTTRAAISRYQRSIESLKNKGMVHASERHRDIENAALEQAIFDDPDDDEPRIVYGDWLQEQGDPRGELIALQRAKKQDAKIVAKQRALFDAHGSWLYGPLDEELHAMKPPTWRLGFLDELDLRLHDDLLAPAVAALAKTHSARFLRKLTLGAAGNYQRSIAHLADAWPRTLRSFCINGAVTGDPFYLVPHRLGSLAAFCKAHPDLVELSLKPEDAPLALDLPKLETLDLGWSRIFPKTIDSLVKSKFPSLRSFGFLVGALPAATLEDYTKLFDVKLFPKLQNLRLAYLFDEDLAGKLGEALRESSLGKQVNVALLAPENNVANVFAHAFGNKITVD